MRRAVVVVTALTSLLVAGAAPAAAEEAPYPMLDVAHSLPTGGLNLWEISLAAEDPDLGVPYLVDTLEEGGFRYAESRTASGDFGDVTPSDDGSPDWLIAHRQPGDGVLLWVVGGGADATPHIWADLRTGGWSWENSRQYVGDVDGDGLDDVVSVHRNEVGGGITWANVWVHLNTGSGFAEPALWTSIRPTVLTESYFISAGAKPFIDTRYALGDITGDGRADLVSIHRGKAQSSVLYAAWPSTGSAFPHAATLLKADSAAGWNFDRSRDLLADLNGDGRSELVNIHSQPNGGILMWARTYSLNPFQNFSDPTLISNLRDGGWSYAGSRQVAADVDGDGADDLVSIHQQQVSGGELIWAHLSDTSGTNLAPPTVLADLRTGGWDFWSSRETVGPFRVTF